MDQIVDRRTVGIPHDIVATRHEVEGMRDAAADSAEESESSANAAAKSEKNAASQAHDALSYAKESEKWATIHNMGITFGPDEPEEKFNGMTWMFTDESARKILSFRRWDAALAGSALWPSGETFPGTSTFPQDRGAWTEFSY